MSSGYVEKRIRKSGWKLIIFGGVGIILVLFSLLISIQYYKNFFTGPVPLTGAELATDVKDGYIDHLYVTLKTDQLIDSGIYTTSTDDNDNEIVKTRYYFSIIDDYVIVTEAEPDTENTNFSGELFWLNTNGEDSFRKSLAEKNIAPGKTFLPIVMLQDDYRTRGYTGIVLSIVILFLSILAVVKGARSLHRKELHPSITELTRLGVVDFVIDQINNEMAFPHEKIGNNHFLSSMVLVETKGGFSVIRYADIVWVYKLRSVSKNLGVFTSAVYSLMVNDKYQKTICMTEKMETVDRLMAKFLPHIPYAYKGYTDELNNVWKRNPDALIRAMEDRKFSSTGSTEVKSSDQSDPIQS